MTHAPSSRKTISEESLQILAIAALDDLVNLVVKASGLKASPEFFDWVADEATPLVEMSVERLFNNSRFMASLEFGDPKVAITLWVRHWVSPQIAARFESLAHHAREALQTGLGQTSKITLNVEPAFQAHQRARTSRRNHVSRFDVISN